MKRLQILIFFAIFPFFGFAQAPFTVELVPTQINGSPAIHSFAWGQADGKWLFMCGRTNGLHGFVPPPGPFPPNGANDLIWVVDPVGNQSYSAAITSLPTNVQDQLLSTNPQFWQDGNTLYIIGGFGFLGQGMGFTTYDYLTAVDVPGLIAAVVNGTSITPYFRQVTDTRLKVTGGELIKIGTKFYLVFGHSWEGGYNRDNPSMGVQNYTYEVRGFDIQDNGTTLSIANYTAWRDTVDYRRRDLTVVPSVAPDGTTPIAEALAGVFRADVDFPHLKPVTITSTGAAMHPSFEQMTSQYTAAHLTLYDGTSSDRHYLLFGGIGAYWFNPVSQTLVIDSLAPFVDNITLLTKNSADVWQETVLGTRMPGLLGSNAVIIQQDGLPETGEHVIRLDQLTGRTLIGHFFGGIAATQPNNGPTSANGQIYEVYITPGMVSAGEPIHGVSLISFDAHPNPSAGNVVFTCTLPAAGDVDIDLFDVTGKYVKQIAKGSYAGGSHSFPAQLKALATGTYIARLQFGGDARFLRIQYISE